MVDLTKYEEGIQYLAENLELPVPKEEMEKRKAMVQGLIATLLRQ